MLIRQIFANCALHQIPLNIPNDPRGKLSVIEAMRDVPFAIERVYFVTDTPSDLKRGHHAHAKLEQYAVCVAGSCVFDIEDGRGGQDSVTLDAPELGLYMGPLLWHVMRDFTPNCVLLVLANAHYDEGDYIRDYATFREQTR